MKIGICDDYAQDRKQLYGLLKAYFGDHSIPVEIALYSNAEDLLKQFSPGAFQMLFLDIFMPGISGIRAAEQIRRQEEDCAIVFTTTSEDYAVKSYALHASGYLVKPYGAKQLAEALDWCIDTMAEQLQAIEVISEREKVLILLKDIRFIEVFGRKAIIHTVNGPIPTNRGLSELQSELPAFFLRSHRSYLVNMQHILRPDKSDFLLEGGQRVPMSVDGTTRIKQQYFDWIFCQTRESR